MVYFVTWFCHNATNDGWAYKVENKYTSYDTALKEFHSQMDSKIDGPTYDIVTVMITDGAGNVNKSETWIRQTSPEPNEE